MLCDINFCWVSFPPRIKCGINSSGNPEDFFLWIASSGLTGGSNLSSDPLIKSEDKLDQGNQGIQENDDIY